MIHYWNHEQVTKAGKIRRLRMAVGAAEICLQHMRLDPHEIAMIRNNRDSEAEALRQLEKED